MSLLQHVGIDYEALAMACKFYRHYGYHQIETPWLVSEASALATSPDGTRGCAFVTDDGQYLVCSAERGFIEMLGRGALRSDTNYFSVSPCFRNEQLDSTHSKTFIKLELFAFFDEYNKKDASIRSVNFLHHASELLLKTLLVPTKIVATEIGFDLVDGNGLELGSYGYRKIKNYYCVYGTGIALPRATIARKDEWDTI